MGIHGDFDNIFCVEFRPQNHAAADRQRDHRPYTSDEKRQVKKGGIVSDRSNAIQVIANQKPTPAQAEPSIEDEIALSAFLAGLSQAIPIPIVDDEAEAFMRKRMIRHIIAAHHLSLSESDIQIFQTSSQHHHAKKAITALAFISANRILQRIALKIVQKATIVLVAKRFRTRSAEPIISDTCSITRYGNSGRSKDPRNRSAQRSISFAVRWTPAR